MRITLVATFVSLGLVFRCSARSSGAPCRAYNTMTPGHGSFMVERRDDNSYSIRANKLEDSAEILVSVKAFGALRGILVQAREALTNKVIGEFDPTNFDEFCLHHQRQRCGDDFMGTVTHKKPWCPARNRCSVDGCEIKMTWTNPKNETGRVVFHLVALQSYDIYYRSESTGIWLAGSTEYEINDCDKFEDHWFNWCPKYCDYSETSCCTIEYQRDNCLKHCCVGRRLT